MTQARELAPQIRREFSPLDQIITLALRQYGEMIPSTVDAETFLMFIDFANEIIEEIQIHPYWTGQEVDYYEHQSEARPIPDPIIKAGILAKYAMQQGSGKMMMLNERYNKTMNTILYRIKYGGSSVKHDLLTFEKDNGSSVDTER